MWFVEQESVCREKDVLKPETIRDYSFSATLVHPPLVYDKRLLSKLEFKLGNSGIDISESKKSETHLEMVTSFAGSREKTVYRAFPDRLSVSHDFSGKVGFEQFKKNLDVFVDTAFEVASVPVLVQQTYLVRQLVSCGDTDSRKYLMNTICGINVEKTNAFNRPIHLFGLRILFPPISKKSYDCNIRIESLLEDIHMLFLENRSNFFGAPIQKDSREIIGKNLDTTMNFLKTEVLKFLSQFPGGE
jgi:hypothetical protein